MNVFRYLASRGYRNKFSEEYSKEFMDRFDIPDKEYDRIYESSSDKNGAENL